MYFHEPKVSENAAHKSGHISLSLITQFQVLVASVYTVKGVGIGGAVAPPSQLLGRLSNYGLLNHTCIRFHVGEESASKGEFFTN